MRNPLFIPACALAFGLPLGLGLPALPGFAPTAAIAQEAPTPPGDPSAASSAEPLSDPMASPEMRAISEALAAIRSGDMASIDSVIRPAAEAGNPRAQNILAGAYQNGWSVAPDPQAALEWYRRAADQGYPVALFNLGLLHTYGRLGLTPDPVAGRGWFGRAVAQDYPPAMAEYAQLLIEGRGGPPEPARGIDILERGAALGDPQARYQLGYYLMNEGHVPADPPRARRLYETAALMGVAKAMLNFGIMLENGQGGPADQAAAEAWYRRALAADDPTGAFFLAGLIGEAPEDPQRRLDMLAHCAFGLDSVAQRTPGWVADWVAWCEDRLAEAPDGLRAQAIKAARDLGSAR